MQVTKSDNSVLRISSQLNPLMPQQCHTNIRVRSESNCPVLPEKEMVETHKDFHDISLLRNVCMKPKDEIPYEKSQCYLPGSDNLSAVTIGMSVATTRWKEKASTLE